MKTGTKRVFILGIDGVGNSPKWVETPNIHKVISAGAYTYDGITAFPPISGECWGTMLHGVDPVVHGLTNDSVAAGPFDINSAYPSIFRLARDKYPDAKLAAFSAWEPINSGIIEQNLNIHFESDTDRPLCESAAKYIRENDPVLLFLDLDDVDAAGHTYGYFTPEHEEAVRQADKNIGIVLDAIIERGMWDDSVIMIVTDHGGGGGDPKDHAIDHPKDMTIFWAGCGPCIPHLELETKFYVGDICAVAAFVLGVKQPQTWTVKIPIEFIK